MKIQYASDLHLEFGENSNQLGYVFANEHTTFNPSATIEIE